MGHYDMEVTIAGKDRDDALYNAKRSIELEHGYSYNFREVISEEFVRLVPPVKWHIVNSPNYGAHTEVHEQYVDESAPLDEWLEEWRFVLDYHV